MRDLIDRSAIKLPPHFFEDINNVPKFYEWLNSLPAASPWHSVEEPPEEYGCYVVYRPYFPWTKAKYIWENGKNRWYSLNGEILCPTHWMPIELPKENV